MTIGSRTIMADDVFISSSTLSRHFGGYALFLLRRVSAPDVTRGSVAYVSNGRRAVSVLSFFLIGWFLSFHAMISYRFSTGV